MKVKILELDIANKNGRIYPKTVFKKALYDVNTLIKNDKFFLLKDRPESSTYNLKNIIGIVKDIEINEYDVYAEINFLNDNEESKILKNSIKNEKLFVRTFGNGSHEIQSNGNFLIGKDYKLLGLFLTDDPA